MGQALKETSSAYFGGSGVEKYGNYFTHHEVNYITDIV